MYYKKLEGKNIYLSPMNVEDAKEFTKWMNDRKVTDGLNSTCKVFNEVSEKAWIENLLEKNAYTFSIVLKDGDKLIGNCGIINLSSLYG